MLEYKKNGVSIIFVSHNLDSVKKLCAKVILFQKGRVHIIGDTESTIEEYYKINSVNMKCGTEGKDAVEVIDAGLLGDKHEGQFAFNSGDNICYVLRIKAKKLIRNMSFGLFIRNDEGMIILDVSSNYQKIEHRLEEGQTAEILFDLKLNLLKGLYYIGINIFGAEGDSPPQFLEYINNISSFMIKGTIPAKGIVNLEPKIAFQINENSVLLGITKEVSL